MRRQWRWGGIASLAALVAIALALRALRLEPASLRVASWMITLEPGSHALDGLRTAVLADFHVGSPWNGIDDLACVVAATNAARPISGSGTSDQARAGARSPPRWRGPRAR